MLVLGLTGSIGMGKSEAAKVFDDSGFSVFDADVVGHRLLETDAAVIAEVGALFPAAVSGDGLERSVIADRVFADVAALTALEEILHPRIHQAMADFLELSSAGRARLAVLELPLLFETGWDSLCDLVAVVTATEAIQKERVLSRPGMTAERLAAVRVRQMSNAEKRAKADFVINTSRGKPDMVRQIKEITASLHARFD